MQASSTNFSAIISIISSCFLVSQWAFNDNKLLPHHWFHGKTGLIFIFLFQQEKILFITNFYKDHGQKTFKFICCLLALYLVTNTIFSLCTVCITVAPSMMKKHDPPCHMLKPLYHAHSMHTTSASHYHQCYLPLMPSRGSRHILHFNTLP